MNSAHIQAFPAPPEVASQRPRWARIVALLGLAVAVGLVPFIQADRAEVARLEHAAARIETIAWHWTQVTQTDDPAALRQHMLALASHQKQRHLRLDRKAGNLDLVEDGYLLRSAPVVMGPPVGVTTLPGVTIELPLVEGARSVAGHVGLKIFPQPEVITRLDEPEGWPDYQGIAPELAYAIVLDDGTVIYSQRGVGPWVDPPVRPGTIAMNEREMAAIIGAIEQGMPVYVY